MREILEGYAFEPRLTADKAKEIIDKAKAVFTPEKGYTFTDFAALSPVEREAYAERYTVSGDLPARILRTRSFQKRMTEHTSWYARRIT